MYDQEEDAIDAFMGSASSFTAAEPGPTRFDTRDERDAVSSLEPISAAAEVQSDASNRNQDPRHPASSDNRGNSSTPMAFNPADNSDAAFGFEFPSMGSNQSSEFFGEQAGTASSSSERHSPASRLQQERQQSQQRENKAERESEDLNQLMAASTDDTHQDARSSTRLEAREQEQQQHQQQEGRYAESRPDEQYHEAGPLEMSMDAAHNSAARDPTSKFSYSPPHQQQQNPLPEPASTTHGTQTAASPRQSQQHDSSAPTMPLNSSATSISSSSTSAAAVGSKRAAPPSPAAASTGSAPMAGSAQPFSWNDILRVQNMIERCLQQYLSKVR